MNVTVNVSTSISEITANKTIDAKIQQPHELFRFTPNQYFHTIVAIVNGSKCELILSFLFFQNVTALISPSMIAMPQICKVSLQ